MAKSVSIYATSALIFVAFMFALASTASAATITNVEFSNGDVTIQGNAGQSVSGKVRVVVPVNEEVEFAEFDITGDSLASVCVNTGRLQEGTHFVQIPGSVKFPPNTGSYNLEVYTAGIFGGLAAIDCVSNVNGSQSFGASVRTVGSNVSPSVSVGAASQWDTLMATLTALIAKLGVMTAPVAPVVSKPACPPAGNTSMVQGWLMANGYASGFHAAGVYSPTGNWGPITTAAYAQASAACK